MGRTVSNKYSIASQHISVLQQVVQGRSAEESIIRSYKKSFSGFAAKLTQKEYENLKSMKEVVSVFPSRTLQLQTTRSWDFLGVPQPSPKQQTAQSDVIVGVIDTGIWPESPSFYDNGLGPIPQKWKGVCHGGKNFTCNKKIIGARAYTGTDARDDEGHGSHTASTAAGRVVNHTSFFGVAEGTARGGVPSARIAVYKVCNSTGCQDSNVLAAFDDAIADGVDVISISVGGNPVKLEEDTIAIGALHAMEKGVLTVHSAGNDGDAAGSTGSVAPWLLSVAASTTDRRVIDRVILGNGQTLTGSTINSFTLKGKKFPLVYGKAASRICEEANAKLCLENCLDKHLVKGKIVVCDGSAPYGIAFRAGALGVLAPTRLENVSFAYPLPAASLGTAAFAELKTYLHSTKNPKANILKSETRNDTTAPDIAQFSSRGPNTIASDILKPDISAPGVDILAAYSPKGHLSPDFPEDQRSATYNMISGTSMACPHVAGAAAYVKSVHPDWSPAAIKSSLMTTANPMTSSTNTDAEFGYGSGNVNPTKATNPGLVYDTTVKDYITFLCRLGYDAGKIVTFTGNPNVTCPKNTTHSPNDVNYPSLSALVDAQDPFSLKFNRCVTNVGAANSTYTAKITCVSRQARITVNPSTMTFGSSKETKCFNVSVVGKGLPETTFVSASLVWTDGVHIVRSPIVVYTSGLN
ncbi:subtilisin-like protease SBT4.3 [Silene latifolia]|uniref:subtilisin-like protease SBT4.3 n=1 Tax=Silene latifolia TaxID=37657 RepID=UPI003D770774